MVTVWLDWETHKIIKTWGLSFTINYLPFANQWLWRRTRSFGVILTSHLSMDFLSISAVEQSLETCSANLIGDLKWHKFSLFVTQ